MGYCAALEGYEKNKHKETSKFAPLMVCVVKGCTHTNIVQPDRSTGNFLNHFKAMHKQEYEQYQLLTHRSSESRERDERNIQAAATSRVSGFLLKKNKPVLQFCRPSLWSSKMQ